MVYDLPGVQINAPFLLESFQDFSGQRQSDRPMLGLHQVDALPLAKEPLFCVHHKEINVDVLDDGWRYSLPKAPSFSVMLSANRRNLLTTPMEASWQQTAMLPLLRTAIECASAMEGVISLHSACVEIEGQAICFTAPSGTGKSTRAAQWVAHLGATLISGDRPSLTCKNGCATVWGVPWDGKEQIYRNVHVPVKAICLITRGTPLKARKLPTKMARQILMQQAFLPMWDTEAAAAVMLSIRRILDTVPILQLQCGPDGAAAEEAYDLIFHHPEKILEESI